MHTISFFSKQFNHTLKYQIFWSSKHPEHNMLCTRLFGRLMSLSECKLFHHEVDVRIHFKAMQVVRIAFKAHQQPTKRDIRRSEIKQMMHTTVKTFTEDQRGLVSIYNFSRKNFIYTSVIMLQCTGLCTHSLFIFVMKYFLHCSCP